MQCHAIMLWSPLPFPFVVFFGVQVFLSLIFIFLTLEIFELEINFSDFEIRLPDLSGVSHCLAEF